MHSDSQQCVNVASFHGDNTGSNPVGDANRESTRYGQFRRNFVGTKRHNFYQFFDLLPDSIAAKALSNL
jgi:hypothetical protein